MASEAVVESTSGWVCVGCGKDRMASTFKLRVPSSVRLDDAVPRGPYCGHCFSVVWPW